MPAAHAVEAVSPLATLDALCAELARGTRVLPALVASNAPTERARLVREVAAGKRPTPRWKTERRPVDVRLSRALTLARRALAALGAHPLAPLYERRIEELALDLSLLETIDHAALVRPLAIRRYGDGSQRVRIEGRARTLADVAMEILARPVEAAEERDLPPDGGAASVAGAMRIAILAAGLDVQVRVEPRLGAGAAAGDRTVFVASRPFGRRECVRLVAHEVLGHAVAAANGAAHPLRIVELGTADAFADQEGLAIAMEAEADALDGMRYRVLAARVVATDAMHAGASFGDTALALHRDHGLPADLAVVTSERAYRGGGVARDAGYLAGYLRVRDALDSGEATIDELRAGRVSLSALPILRALGIVTPHRPSTSLVLSRVRVAITDPARA
jgi:hypothetical protein